MEFRSWSSGASCTKTCRIYTQIQESKVKQGGGTIRQCKQSHRHNTRQLDGGTKKIFLSAASSGINNSWKSSVLYYMRAVAF